MSVVAEELGSELNGIEEKLKMKNGAEFNDFTQNKISNLLKEIDQFEADQTRDSGVVEQLNSGANS